eukprot:10826899-Lingulodinium_polyedra.AAC.1
MAVPAVTAALSSGARRPRTMVAPEVMTTTAALSSGARGPPGGVPGAVGVVGGGERWRPGAKDAPVVRVVMHPRGK